MTKTLIRPFRRTDFFAVKALLLANGWTEIPSSEELETVGFVAKADDMVVGFVWAMTNGKAAFIDFFCVHQDFRVERDVTGSGALPVKLIFTLILFLKDMGIRTIYGVTAADAIGEGMTKIYQRSGMTVKPCTALVVGQAETILKRFIELRKTMSKGESNGKQDNINSELPASDGGREGP